MGGEANGSADDDDIGKVVSMVKLQSVLLAIDRGERGDSGKRRLRRAIGLLKRRLYIVHSALHRDFPSYESVREMYE